MQLVLVTDGRGDLGRIERVVASAIAGGCRCVQLREPQWSARLMEDACARLSPTSSSVGGALLALATACVSVWVLVCTGPLADFDTKDWVFARWVPTSASHSATSLSLI